MSVATADTVIQPTKAQERILMFRGHANILSGGGRGGGKSFALLLDIVDHVREPWARPLVLRESWAGLLELSDELYALCLRVFGSGVTRNKKDGTLTLQSGAVVTFSNVGDEASFAKLQGRSFTGLFADELGNYSPEGYRFFRRAMSSLRAPEGHRCRIHATANPHGRSHTRVVREFIRKAPPWQPFIDEHGETWVWCSGTFEDNQHIDRDAYRRKLLASTGGDENLARAWIEGDWNVLGGCMFDLFDPKVHTLVVQSPIPRDAFRLRIGADWGTASPCAGLLIGRLNEPRGHWRADDLFVLDEVDTALGDDLTAGAGHSVAAWAEELRGMCERNEVPMPTTVQDDARGLVGDTVVAELCREGIPAHRPYRKDRVGGWALIRSLLANAKSGEGGPGLWIATRCQHLIETIAEAPRSPTRAEDIDPKYLADHWLDALSYGVSDLHGRQIVSTRTTGWY